MRKLRSLTAPALAVAASATVIALLAATPASAATYANENPIDVGGFRWQITADGQFGIGETRQLSSSFDEGYHRTTFQITDGALQDGTNVGIPLQFACENPDLADADVDGDRIVSCDVEVSPNGLLLDGEVRIFGEGDLARQLFTITNPTADSLSLAWIYNVNYGDTTRRATSSLPTLGDYSDRPYVNGDTWSSNVYSEDGYTTLAASAAWALSSIDQPLRTVAENTDRMNAEVIDVRYDGTVANGNVDLELAPGAVLTLAFFSKVVPAVSTAEEAGDLAAADLAVAVAADEFASFSGRLVRGLENGLDVFNWGVVDGVAVVEPGVEAPGPAAPALAATGSDVTVMLIAAGGSLALLTLGGVMLMRRRVAMQPQVSGHSLT